jgi:hypothetical protein
MSRIKYLWDTSALEFEVVKTAVPKVDDSGVQRKDPMSKNPVWAVELTAYQGEDGGAETLLVSVASAEKPELRWRQPVELVGLEMIPWANKGRSDRDPIRQGVSFRVQDIRPVDASSLRAVA